MQNRALMSIVYDGGKLFKIWYQYYCQYFLEENIYLLSHKTPPSLFEGLKCNIIEFFRPMQIHATKEERKKGLALINNFQHQLFNKYDCVVYADIDEILFHPKGLDTVINNLTVDFGVCKGYEIVQNRSREKPFDFSRPVSEQRSYWFKWPVYDKPLILKKPAEWKQGFHTIVGQSKTNPANKVSALYLLHLHKIDFELAREMHLRHNIFTNETHESWWRSAEDHLKPIPTGLKEKFNF